MHVLQSEVRSTLVYRFSKLFNCWLVTSRNRPPPFSVVDYLFIRGWGFRRPTQVLPNEVALKQPASLLLLCRYCCAAVMAN